MARCQAFLQPGNLPDPLHFSESAKPIQAGLHGAATCLVSRQAWTRVSRFWFFFKAVGSRQDILPQKKSLHGTRKTS